MRQRATRQRKLFDDNDALRRPILREAEGQTVMRLLVEWMQAVAKAIDAEGNDEKDQR